MAKKTRRVRRKGTQAQLSEAQLVQPGQATREAPQKAEVEAEGLSQQAGDLDLQEEYGYVVTDLKRLGILAAAILGVMLVLFFVVAL
jgi:hypothetical protein